MYDVADFPYVRIGDMIQTPLLLAFLILGKGKGAWQEVGLCIYMNFFWPV